MCTHAIRHVRIVQRWSGRRQPKEQSERNLAKEVLKVNQEKQKLPHNLHKATSYANSHMKRHPNDLRHLRR
jgi:hypothetical protein